MILFWEGRSELLTGENGQKVRQFSDAKIAGFLTKKFTYRTTVFVFKSWQPLPKCYWRQFSSLRVAGKAWGEQLGPLHRVRVTRLGSKILNLSTGYLTLWSNDFDLGTGCGLFKFIRVWSSGNRLCPRVFNAPLPLPSRCAQGYLEHSGYLDPESF